MNLGVHAYWEGRWQDAVDLFDRARTIFKTVGNSLGDVDATFNIGEILSQQGRLEEAEPHIREAARLWRSASHAYAPLATSELGRIAYRTGRFSELARCSPRPATSSRRWARTRTCARPTSA